MGPSTALVALHYQNENCHPDGRIKVGIGPDSDWREARLANARRLFAGLRAVAVPIVYVRLAVPPDYRGVIVNTPLIEDWIKLGAWKEGTWGTEFVAGLGPADDEYVVTHTRNSGFHNSTLEEILFSLQVRRLICAGVSTAYAVEGTVRQATDIGYHVWVAADACSTATAVQHEAALRAMSAIADIKTVDDILTELQNENRKENE